MTDYAKYTLMRLFPAAMALMLIWSCSGHTKLPDPGPTFLLNRSVDRIDADSDGIFIWSGFRQRDAFFTSDRVIAKLILWRAESAEETMSLQYVLSKKKAELFVNSNKICELDPTLKQKTVVQTVPLQKGFNFIEFRMQDASILKLKSLSVSDKTIRENDGLGRKAEYTWTRYYARGKGIVELRLSGEVRIRQVQFNNGRSQVLESKRKSPFLSSTLQHQFEFAYPGYLEFASDDEGMAVTGCIFNEEEDHRRLSVPAAAKESAQKNRPHVFILLIDGCHAEHTGLNNYFRDTTPHIDQLAQDAVVFENAYTNATFTRSSVASIFTGYYTHRHKLRILTNRLPKGLFMLPEFLKQKGYETALLTEAGNISRAFGFSQGVDNYQKVFRRWDDPRYLENNIFRFFCEWLERPRGDRVPLFTYVHFRAPHFPIVPPPPYLDMYKENKLGKDADRLIAKIDILGEGGHVYSEAEIADIVADYDSAIAYVDGELGKMIAHIKKLGLYDSSYIIVTSDHGEALYEHKYLGHGHNVYDETSRVPLLVKFPADQGRKGLRIKKVVQLVDIFPTFAALYDENRFFDGRSLFESLEDGGQYDDVMAFSTSFGSPPAVGIRWREWHYIYHMYSGKQELFNLEVDPLLDVSKEAENSVLTTFFHAKFLNWLLQFDNSQLESQSVDLKTLPQDVRENLKSLGYID